MFFNIVYKFNNINYVEIVGINIRWFCEFYVRKGWFVYFESKWSYFKNY